MWSKRRRANRAQGECGGAGRPQSASRVANVAQGSSGAARPRSPWARCDQVEPNGSTRPIGRFGSRFGIAPRAPGQSPTAPSERATRAAARAPCGCEWRRAPRAVGARAPPAILGWGVPY
eukprot:1097507-Prymnesium_polylepis.2